MSMGWIGFVDCEWAGTRVYRPIGFGQWKQKVGERRGKDRLSEPTAGPSTALLAKKPREASLRMTLLTSLRMTDFI